MPPPTCRYPFPPILLRHPRLNVALYIALGLAYVLYLAISSAVGGHPSIVSYWLWVVWSTMILFAAVVAQQLAARTRAYNASLLPTQTSTADLPHYQRLPIILPTSCLPDVAMLNIAEILLADGQRATLSSLARADRSTWALVSPKLWSEVDLKGGFRFTWWKEKSTPFWMVKDVNISIDEWSPTNDESWESLAKCTNLNSLRICQTSDSGLHTPLFPSSRIVFPNLETLSLETYSRDCRIDAPTVSLATSFPAVRNLRLAGQVSAIDLWMKQSLSPLSHGVENAEMGSFPLVDSLEVSMFASMDSAATRQGYVGLLNADLASLAPEATDVRIMISVELREYLEGGDLGLRFPRLHLFQQAAHISLGLRVELPASDDSETYERAVAADQFNVQIEHSDSAQLTWSLADIRHDLHDQNTAGDIALALAATMPALEVMEFSTHKCRRTGCDRVACDWDENVRMQRLMLVREGQEVAVSQWEKIGYGPSGGVVCERGGRSDDSRRDTLYEVIGDGIGEDEHSF